MKSKEAIKQIQEGKIQVFNDLLPKTKPAKKFIKKCYPNKQSNGDANYYAKDEYRNEWEAFSFPFENLPVINLSTITKRKKTKLSQLETLISDVIKDVSELRQTLAKHVEVDVEEVKSELIVGEWYLYNDNLLVYNNGETTYGICYGIFSNDFHFSKHRDIARNCKPATPQEVQTALENEAKKRGYNDKVGIKGLKFGEAWTKSGNIEFKYDEKQNTLQMWSDFAETKSDGWKDKSRAKINIFKDGIWSEIIQQETIKEEEIDWSRPQKLISKYKAIVISTGEHTKDTFEGLSIIDNEINGFLHKTYRKERFKPFKGELTIK